MYFLLYISEISFVYPIFHGIVSSGLAVSFCFVIPAARCSAVRECYITERCCVLEKGGERFSIHKGEEATARGRDAGNAKGGNGQAKTIRVLASHDKRDSGCRESCELRVRP